MAPLASQVGAGAVGAAFFALDDARAASAALALAGAYVPAAADLAGLDNLRRLASFASGLGGMAGKASLLGRLWSAAALDAGGGVYAAATIVAANALLPTFAAALADTLASGAMHTASGEMAPVPGAAPMPPDVLLQLSGARLRQVLRRPVVPPPGGGGMAGPSVPPAAAPAVGGSVDAGGLRLPSLAAVQATAAGAGAAVPPVPLMPSCPPPGLVAWPWSRFLEIPLEI